MSFAERYSITVRKVDIDGEWTWRATVAELPDVAEFGESSDEAINLAIETIEALKSVAESEGRTFPEPLEVEEEFSGRVTLRLPKSLHRRLALEAMSEGVSLNSWLISKCSTNSFRDSHLRDIDAHLMSIADQARQIGFSYGDHAALVFAGGGEVRALANMPQNLTATGLLRGSAQIYDLRLAKHD
jgi:predicted HicB family RNase H-like nuclease